MVCDPILPAKNIYDNLKNDPDIVVPPNLSSIKVPSFPAVDPNLFTDVPSVKTSDLTEGKTGGSGVFDQLMTSVTAHLDRERTAGRITNNDFAKSYVDFSNGAMAGAIQFLLSKDAAHWQAIAAQTQAKLALVELTKAEVELEEAKFRMQMMAYQAAGARAQTALTKMQLATAKVEYCISEYRLNEIMPKEALILTAQKAQLDAEKLHTEAQTVNVTQTTNTLLPEQVRNTKMQADTASYALLNHMPKMTEQMTAQVNLVKEQHESQRAQTMDLRSDGVTPVTGTLGKQKDLHTQQIKSYQLDAQLKAARPFVDAWITMKTIDEGIVPPVNFNNANLDSILGVLRDANDLR